MRNALNSNPVVQAAVIGVMALAVAFLLFTRVLGGNDKPADDASAGSAETTPAAPADAATGAAAAPETAPAPATAAPPADAAAADAAAVPAPVPDASGGDVQSNFIPG